jgi:hypothetical protein
MQLGQFLHQALPLLSLICHIELPMESLATRPSLMGSQPEVSTTDGRVSEGLQSPPVLFEFPVVSEDIEITIVRQNSEIAAGRTVPLVQEFTNFKAASSQFESNRTLVSLVS